MMNQQTMDKLREMKLNGLAAAWLDQQERPDHAGLGFDERFGLLIDAEWMSRQNARLKRNLKEAHLKLGSACLEDLDYDERRGLDKPLIRQLATCGWVAQHQNIVITGATGTGKSFLACALAQHALRRRYRAIYRRTSRLFDELALARADGTYARLLAKLARVDVLILDDWAMAPLGAAERRDMSELMEDRYGERSTILTSQRPPELWHDQIGDPTTADAICDRMLSQCHRLMLKGPSRRKEVASQT
jgi:DNA replication protein DnaC